MTGIQYQDDASLHRWGRNLGTIAPAVHELAGRHGQLQAEVEQAVAVVNQLAGQGATDVPGAKAVVAEVEAIKAELASIQGQETAAKLKRLAERAEALGALYRSHHETDEGRLNGERGSRAQERRADVGAAEQDT